MRSKIFFIVLFIIVSFSSFATTTKRFALFVGANNGGQGREILRYAVSDAKSVANVFMEMGGIEEAQSLVLVDPSVEELSAEIKQMSEKIRLGTNYKRTEFVFYYSGHSDEEGLLLKDKKYEYRRLRNEIENIGSDMRIVIMDSCASGAFTRKKGGVIRPAFMTEDNGGVKGYAFLTSSASDEVSQESDAIGASFFTHALISGLRGAADLSDDGKVTLTEAYQFAYNETLSKTEKTLSGAQHANYDMDMSGSGDIVLTDLRITTAALLLRKDIDGRIFFRDADSKLIAEVEKKKGREMEIGLPAGDYSITLDTEEYLFTAERALVYGERKPLAFSDFKRTERQYAVARGTSPEKAYSFKPFKISLIPEVWNRDEIENDYVYNSISLGLVGAISSKVHGAAVGGIMHMIDSDLRGIQVSGIFNTIGGDTEGLQVAPIFSITEGSLRGVQANAIFNITEGSVDGIQAAPIFSIASLGVKGLQVSGIFNTRGGTLRGVQASGIISVGEGNTTGLQAGGIGSVCEGNVTGVVGAGVFSVVSGSNRMAQFSGIVGVNEGYTKGVMLSGIAAVNKGEFYGVKAAAIVNASGGIFRGVQIAGIVNVSENMEGLQASAIVNVAKSNAKGAQISLVNVAGRSDGLMLGFVNVCDETDGLPVGFINIIKRGMRHLSLWADEATFINAGFKNGSEHFYNLYWAGLSTDLKHSVFGLGIGAQYSFGKDREKHGKPFFVNADVLVGSIHENTEDYFISSLPVVRGRAGIGIAFLKHFGIQAGITYSIVSPYHGGETEYIPNELPFGRETFIKFSFDGKRQFYGWPGFYAGIQF